MSNIAEDFYLCCAEAVKARAVVLVGRYEFLDRYAEEADYLKQKRGMGIVYEPLAKLGYENFIAVNDSPFMNDGAEIITLFEVVG